MCVPLDFSQEVSDQSALRHTVDLGVDVLELEACVVAFAISVIIRIVDDVDETVVAHATRKGWLNDLRMLAPPDLTWHSGKAGITHLDIVIRHIEVILQQQPTAKIVLDVSWASPGIAL